MIRRHAVLRRHVRTRKGFQSGPTLCLLEERALPANLVVTNGADDGGAGQLRACLTAAISNGEANTITFDPSVATITLTNALPTYTSAFNLNIAGEGILATVIQAPPASRIFR